MKTNSKIKVIISGGGTGGHIFPALSIADGLRSHYLDAEILFVGAEGRMEMERVPNAGYKIIGLPVRGLKRKITLDNIKVIIDFLRSRKKAKSILKTFKPDIVVGVGGYASAPVLNAASKMKIPSLLQEQNSYAGMTNKMLSKKASVICVAYDNMERYFPADKIIKTGNPVRKISLNEKLRQEALQHFGLKSDIPVLFIMGGSLGARTINQSILKNIELLANANIQVIWQTGKYYYDEMKRHLSDRKPDNIHILDFVTKMELAYNAANLVVSRAGALSLSEICLVGKPSILVPSPNVAEDHQTKNATALVEKDAAIMVRDNEAIDRLVAEAVKLITDKQRLQKLSENAKKLAEPEATAKIVAELEKLLIKK
jgi:UDP-N-acetylglucosamine--N-acetylmuramyl-(pentapeptide) pyrophosphoryl-undecaprenol N-acetylglucosamine transferase